MPLNVYYLDDEKDLLENFYDLFSSDTIKITIFSDPKTALEAIEQNPPDLLFVDYRLPGTTGDQVAAKVKTKIPTALITGDMQINSDFPFVRIFEKPVNIDVVEAFIKSYIKNAA